MHVAVMIRRFLCVAVLVAMMPTAAHAAPPPDLPESERRMMNTVDPWGLAFSDQLWRYQAIFTNAPRAGFAIGITHDLVKVWPNKYWFRGETAAAGQPLLRAKERWSVAGEVQSFQVAVLPRVGASGDTYYVTADAPGAEVEIFREVFVKTSPGATYPRFASERWPDPLVAELSAGAADTDCCVFWVDVRIPKAASRQMIECKLAVSNASGEMAAAVVPMHVVTGLEIDPKAYPCVAWFARKKMSEDDFRGMCELVLRHHLVPMDALKGVWDAAHPEKFDELRAFLVARGQRLFEVDSANSKTFDSLYAHLKEKGWLASAISYSNVDEPGAEIFARENVPFMRQTRQKYPGLRIFLASDRHANMEQGCDIWMTDLSASGYDPVRDRDLPKPELWHYYCHLPIGWQMRAPLVEAPNMQIDNPALEHRLALWMSHYFGAKAVFIYAGNSSAFGDNFWKTLTLPDALMPFPYGGVANGNGWLIYPGPDGKGTAPSVRLKILRDGLEDIALFESVRAAIRDGKIKGDRAQALSKLLDPVPDVFVRPHYFDRLPEKLLAHRDAILQILAEQQLRQ